MILDGDLSVRPEDLPKFYNACTSGRAELVNGSRRVYDMEAGAMRCNQAFSWLVKTLIAKKSKTPLRHESAAPRRLRALSAPFGNSASSQYGCERSDAARRRSPSRDQSPAISRIAFTKIRIAASVK